jgi:hypothetical protein
LRPPRLYQYLFEDNSALTIRRQIGWCIECDCVAFIESVPTIEQLTVELETVSSKNSKNSNDILEPIVDIKKRIEWRKTRKSPPRCLDCGSVDTSVLDFTEIDEKFSQTTLFKHKCGGFLQLRDDPDGLRIAFRRSDIPVLHDSEGNYISGNDFFRQPKLPIVSQNIVDKNENQYINPFALLGFSDYEIEPDALALRRAIKKSFAEIELSDCNAIIFTGIRITKSDLHTILDGLDNKTTYDYHLSIFSNSKLLAFLHSPQVSDGPSFEWPTDSNLLTFLFPYLAFSFASAISACLSHFELNRWAGIFSYINKMPSSYHDTVIIPVRRKLEDVLDEVGKFQQSIANETTVNTEQLSQKIKQSIENRIRLVALDQVQIPNCR